MKTFSNRMQNLINRKYAAATLSYNESPFQQLSKELAMKTVKLLALAAALAVSLSACAYDDYYDRDYNGNGSYDQDYKRDRDYDRVREREQRRQDRRETPDRRFECRNGMTATVKYSAGIDRINLFVDTVGQEITLNRSRAASGELYTAGNGFYGKRTEWHQKGGSGILSLTDPYGNFVETTCRIR
ncbi:hypothetical protein EGS38_06955 [Neisseria chenwenguii]|nr:hypothetical protein EGS38_06955 [Neisseria chenwenguii]